MRASFPRACRLAALVLAFFAPSAALADDLPARVGRLAEVGGRVYLATEQRAEDWLDARRNDTVTTGDNLWVSGDGRAEIDYGGGQLRLAGDTNVHLARLDDTVLALFVAQGRVVIRVRVLEPGEAARVDTPNAQIALTRPGLYRIDVSGDRMRTELVVREGEATAAFATGLQQVLPGQTAVLQGAEPALAEVRHGYLVDGFDTWSAARDRRYERSRSATYVSRQMIGYADLDEHGQWETVPEYGALWLPSGVAADWAPYRFGRWSWVGGWGWTWVDDAPWGYAPFHYGRWVWHGGRWGWAPGGFVGRPVWSPAMVAWYGGAGWSYSATFGAPVFGWVPLAWGEPFVPWWGGCSHRCWTQFNRPYAVNLAERPNAPPTRFANWTVPGGVTAVPGATFTGRKPVHQNIVDAKPYIASAPMLAGAPTLAKPSPAAVSAARPGYAPLPAAALQTKPMRLPTPSASGPGATYAGPGAVAAPPAVNRPPSVNRPVAQGGQAAAPPAAAPAARPPSRAPAQPGMWGATGQMQQSPQAMPNAAPGAVPNLQPVPSRPAINAAPPAAYLPPPASGAPPIRYAPAPAPVVPRAVPGGGNAPPSAPPGAVLPYSAPPGSPAGTAVVPQIAPPTAAAGPPPVNVAPPLRFAPSPGQEAGGRVDPPGRPVPKDQMR